MKEINFRTKKIQLKSRLKWHQKNREQRLMTKLK